MKYTYCRHSIDDDDIAAVVAALKSDRLTQGPLVEEFERKFAYEHGRRYGVAVANGTAALHCAINASFGNLSKCNTISVPTMTFAATANVVVMSGAELVLADVDASSLLVTVDSVLRSFSTARSTCSYPSGIVLVDYAGQLCDPREFVDYFRVPVVVDACHSAGGRHYDTDGAAAYCYSFHAAKNMTTGEGGMILTDNETIRDECRILRNHGRVQTDDEFGMDQVCTGLNSRITDLQCALGISQLAKVADWNAQRAAIARAYDAAFIGTSVVPVARQQPHANHLYVVSVPQRRAVRMRLEAYGIGTAIHYRPVHQLAYYRKSRRYDLPVADQLATSIMSLPMGPWMAESDAQQIAANVLEAVDISERQAQLELKSMRILYQS